MKKYAIDLDEAAKRAFSQLKKNGFVLESDKTLPSVVSLVAGAPVSGSWWAHPLGQETYGVCRRLIHHADVLVLKLVNKKITYVHRSLWSCLLAVAMEKDRWQMDGLPLTARNLLAKVSEAGSLRIDELRHRRTLKELGEDARALEARLLVFGDDVHTESGTHVKRMEAWPHWAGRVGFARTNA